MNKIISLIIAFVILYLEFAIFVINEQMVGKIGFIFAKTSHEYLGYIAYIYLFIFLYILYKLNFDKLLDGIDLSLRVITLLTFLSH